MMARRTFITVICNLVIFNLAFASASLGQESGQGLLSRLRNANADQKASSKDPLNDSSDEGQVRRWNAGMRFPMQSFSLPWTGRSAEPKSSIQAPIDLPGAMAPRGKSNSGPVPTTASPNLATTGPIGSGVARQPAKTTPTPYPTSPIDADASEKAAPSPVTSQESLETATDDSSLDTNSRKELRVYNSAPSPSPIDSKNTSRRKPVQPPPASKPAASTLPNAPTPNNQPTRGLPPIEAPLDLSPNPAGADPVGADPVRIPAISASARKEQAPIHKKTAALDVRTPQLRLRVDGPQAIQVGQKATYTIHATNEGDSELEGLIIRASTPKAVVIDEIKTLVGAYELDETAQDIAVLWELEHLGANDSKSLELQIEVIEADQFALNLEWTVAPRPSQMTVQVQQPKIELDLSGPSHVEVQTPQKYRMRVKNSGSADLPELNLVLQTETTSEFESQIGPLAAGSEKLIDVELTFDQVGLFPIVATAKDPSGKLQHRQRVDVQVQKLELRASWTGPEEFIMGTPTVYQLAIENVGGIAASNIDCSIELPDGIEVLELPQGYALTANQIRWTLASIPSDSQFTLPIRCRLNRSGNHALVFHARSAKDLNLQARITTVVESIADLELSVKEPQAPAPVGTPVVYEIQLVNRGSKAAENVRVIAQFSDGIEPLKVEGHAGRIVPGQALFEEVAAIQPNQTMTLKVICQASKNGVHRFRAAVQSPTSQEDLLEEGSTRFVGGATKSSKP